MNENIKIERALISVSDKTGLRELANALGASGVEIVSTGGTAREIRSFGIDVADVSEVTGFPEMMDGRVKTLHPKIHGAFLALRDDAGHLASMKEHEIEPIDLVVVNLYPFESTIARPDVDLAEAVENIDIGGPAMIRSAAKNWRSVAVVTDPREYPVLIEELAANGGALTLRTRARLAADAYSRTAAYDTAIGTYLNAQLAEKDAADELPERFTISGVKSAELRYGENPHQSAALYTNGDGKGIAGAEQLHGKEMSFNNYVDANAAWELVSDLSGTAVAIIKHTNPSGVGLGASNLEAYRRALSTDPVSAFGGIVAFKQAVDAEAARAVIEVFSEVVVAPDFDDEALEIFRSKKNLRLLRVESSADRPSELKQISGGFLVQSGDAGSISPDALTIVTERKPSEDELRAMMLAWKVAKHVRSNAIVFANAVQTLGVGAGQMNRVDSVRIAAMRAERFELSLEGAALASDAFFPFRDNVDEAAKIGISAIIQPGGSIKDDESIAAANEHGIAMAFTGMRHFKH